MAGVVGEDFARKLSVNLRAGRRMLDAIRDGSISRPVEEERELAATYARLAIEQGRMLANAQSALRPWWQSALGVTLRAGMAAGIYEAYRRRGPLAAAGLVFAWGAARELSQATAARL